MSPATITIISSVLTALIGKLFDGYFAKNKKYPKYIGVWPMLKRKLKKQEERKMLDGKKLIIGAIFGAICYFLTGVETLLSPQMAVISQAVTGALGVFFAGVGIAGKADKFTKALLRK